MPRNECQFHPDSLFSLEKLNQHKWMEFWKFKRFSLRRKKKKNKDYFLKIKQSLRRHTMLLLPNVSHYHSEYFCLRFMAVWVCFLSNRSLPKEPLLICNLKKKKFPTDICRQLLPSIANSAFKWDSIFAHFQPESFCSVQWKHAFLFPLPFVLLLLRLLAPV